MQLRKNNIYLKHNVIRNDNKNSNIFQKFDSIKKQFSSLLATFMKHIKGEFRVLQYIYGYISITQWNWKISWTQRNLKINKKINKLNLHKSGQSIIFSFRRLKRKDKYAILLRSARILEVNDLIGEEARNTGIYALKLRVFLWSRSIMSLVKAVVVFH